MPASSISFFDAKATVQDKINQVELKVIGAGLGRTGTTSLQEALVILGIAPCHHFVSVVQDQFRALDFCRAYDGAPTDWRDLMSGFRPTLDHTSSDFVVELMEAFPEALVILTVRDNPQAWWKSFIKTVIPVWQWPYVLSVYPLLFLRIPSQIGPQISKRVRGLYGPHGPSTYELHNMRIKRIVPKEKLLVVNVKEGWEPLCRFLGVPIPDVPFPNINDTAAFNKAIREYMLMGQALWVGGIAAASLLVYQRARYLPWKMLG